MNPSVSHSRRFFGDGLPQEERSPLSLERWHTFEDILERLHNEGIYIHSEQLATFLIFHGLPVNLCYVPEHLKHKAQFINEHYAGDMAQSEVF
jgi:hypothetical protein